jgi:hypothetical protein
MPLRRQDVSIETVHEPARSRVIAEGELDVACVVGLNRAMSEASRRDVPIDLDLSGVTFADSRFAAAVGGWERNLEPGRLTVELPVDVRVQRVLALRSQRRTRFRRRPSGEIATTADVPEELGR